MLEPIKYLRYTEATQQKPRRSSTLPDWIIGPKNHNSGEYNEQQLHRLSSRHDQRAHYPGWARFAGCLFWVAGVLIGQ